MARLEDCEYTIDAFALVSGIVHSRLPFSFTGQHSQLGERHEIYSPLARWGEGSGVRGWAGTPGEDIGCRQKTPHPQPLSPAGERGVDFMPLASVENRFSTKSTDANKADPEMQPGLFDPRRRDSASGPEVS